MRLIWGAAFALCATAAAADGSMTLRGQGAVTATPDIAIVTLGVREQAKEASDAMGAVNQATGAIFDRLAEFGIEARDMQTTDLSLGQVWAERKPGQPPEVAGYQASNQVTVRLRDIAQAGPLIDAVLQDGANQLNGLQFQLSDPSQAMAEARRAAVADAMEKAKLYADAAGVRLGEITAITEAQINQPQPMMRMAAMEGDMAIAAGETSVTATVQITWDLED